MLLLLALAGTQAYASTAQLVRLCNMAPVKAACHCPSSTQATDPQPLQGPALDASCCDRHVVQALAATVVPESGRMVQVAHPPVASLAALPRSPLASWVLPSTRWTSSQGPPLFLRIRTLLI
ncbi:MAG: hypothetical protein M3Y59_10410 [Myxococcota bacterium]|nr:hypothetical protein [Myxococcota bacterium]